jgi:hypothetical protein
MAVAVRDVFSFTNTVTKCEHDTTGAYYPVMVLTELYAKLFKRISPTLGDSYYITIRMLYDMVQMVYYRTT